MPPCRPLLALLLLLTVPAAAEPRQLGRPERARLKAAISDAHKAEKRGDHAAGAAAYQRALALRPDDGRLLSELGLQLYLAKDLPRAEAATRKAIAVSKGRLRAASLFNLGKILEGKGDKAGAVKAYVESLEGRPDRTVMKALARLDPAAAAAADPLRPRPMDGPYPSLEAWCDARGRKDRERCPIDPFLGGQRPALKAAGPWLEARVLDGESSLCTIAVRTARGWFVRANAFDCDVTASRLDDGQLAVKELVGGAPPELELRAQLTHREFEAYSGGGDDSFEKPVDKDCEEVLVACGLGPSKTPSCFQVSFAMRPTCESEEARWELKLAYGDGVVEVTDDGGDLTSEAKAYLGKHPLRFP